jgi:hypothetical protein
VLGGIEPEAVDADLGEPVARVGGHAGSISPASGYVDRVNHIHTLVAI